jgi:hypothetical protein
MPFRLAARSGAVVPDAVFGIEYRKAEWRANRSLALEVDRGTMPITRANGVQISQAGRLVLYGEIIGSQAQKQLFGIPNLFVLTLTTNQTRLRNLHASA